MNQVILIGRLARDPELSYTPNTQSAVCRFTIAVDRPRRNGEDAGADFIRITVWGRQAETCDRYLSKGRQVAIQGRIQTGSYKNREGVTVYTTDVVADRVEFLGSGQGQAGGQGSFNQGGSYGGQSNSYGSSQGGYNQGNSYGGQGYGQGGQFGGQGGYNQSRDTGAPQQSGGFGSQDDGFGGSGSGFGGSDSGSGFDGQDNGLGGPESLLGDDGGSGSRDFGGFDDLPDTFQAAEDDIPF